MKTPEAAIAALAFASIAVGLIITRARTAAPATAEARRRLGARRVAGFAVGIALVLLLALAPARSSLADVVVILVIMWSATRLAGRSRRASPIPPAVASDARPSRWFRFLEELGRAAMTCGVRNGVPWVVYDRDLRLTPGRRSDDGRSREGRHS